MACQGVLEEGMATLKSDLRLQIQQTSPIPLFADLECAAGHLLALVGPSGSGKSTLLRMIAGLSRPQSGHIACGGQVWFDDNNHMTPQQRRTGYVPQHYGLFPHMSALENVKAGLHHLANSEQLKRAREWLARMHLDGLQQRKPSELSGGQQQRVAVARALAGDPSILLLDEPFSAVDSSTREKLYSELAELKHQLRIPIIMVTHDLNEALLLADRMTLINHGRTLQSGVPRDIMVHPCNEAAAQLVGMRNLFDGEIIEHDAGQSSTRLRLGAHVLDSPYRPELTPGTSVRWVIPDNGVRFRAISRAESVTSCNRLEVMVSKLLTLGDEVRLSMQIDNVSAPLLANIPLRLATELNLAARQRTAVVLRAEDIHIFASHE